MNISKNERMRERRVCPSVSVYHLAAAWFARVVGDLDGIHRTIPHPEGPGGKKMFFREVICVTMVPERHTLTSRYHGIT